MDFSTLIPYAQLGGTVFTVIIFVRYLTSRDQGLSRIIDEGVTARNRNAGSNLSLAKSLQRLTDVIERNTTSIGTSKVSIDKNTGAVDKNTAVVVDSSNGNHE